MSWSQQVFAYCERGQDGSFWAEPVNAITNGAFLIAAFAALALWRARPAHERCWAQAWLILLIFAVGAGSFLFHTYATRWSALADVVPIGLFMVSYLVYAVRRFLRENRIVTSVATIAFVAALGLAGGVRCGDGPCLNGSVGYLPALFALVVVGLLARGRGRRQAGDALLLGSAVFAVSLTFRTLDMDLCDMATTPSHGALGTHFMWHVLNGALLFILARAAILHGDASEDHPTRGSIPKR